MHRHDAALRQNEVQQPEDRLFHFAGIGSAADQDQLLGEIDRDYRFGAAAVPFGIGAKARQVDDRVFGVEPRQLIRLGPHQQGSDEQIVPGKLVDDPHPHPVLRLRSSIEISNVELLLVGKCQQEIIVQPFERFRVHRLVAVVPPDHIFGKRILDRELVLRASAGVLAGANHQRSILGEKALAAAHRMLDQRRGRQVPEDLRASRNTLRLQSAVRNSVTHVAHSFHKCSMRRRPGGACRRMRMERL